MLLEMYSEPPLQIIVFWMYTCSGIFGEFVIYYFTQNLKLVFLLLLSNIKVNTLGLQSHGTMFLCT
jgi:hypothetical protein